MAVTQDQVNAWFDANPNASADEVAAAVKSVGGLETNTGLADMIANRYSIGTNAVNDYYNNYISPSGGLSAVTSGNNAAVQGGSNTSAPEVLNAPPSTGALTQVTTPATNNLTTGALNQSVLNTSNVGSTTPNYGLSGVILAGDSWLAGDDFTNIASTAFGQPVTNTAIGGQKTSDVLNQLNVFERDGGTFAPGSTVVLSLGGNDLATGVDETTIRNNLNEIVSRLGAKGVKVILSGAPDADSYDDAISSTNLQMHDLYDEVAASNSNVTLVDVMSGLLNDKTLMDASGFHLKDEASKTAYIDKLEDAYNGLSVADKAIVDSKLATVDTTDLTAVAKVVDNVAGTNVASTNTAGALAQATTPVTSAVETSMPASTTLTAAQKAELATSADTTKPATIKAEFQGKTYDLNASDVQNVKAQILAQGTTSQWSGEGFGSAEANAEAMAKNLVASGVKDINDVALIDKKVDAQVMPDGQGGFVDALGRPVDASLVKENTDYGGESGNITTTYTAPIGTEKVIGNKLTGEQLISDYDRSEGSAWSGTFTGEGNTAFRTSFDASGKPIFYTTGASSNDLVTMIGDDPILGKIAYAAAASFGGPAGVAALQAAMGKSIEDIAKGALLTYVGGQVAGNISGSTDLINSVGADATNVLARGAGQFISSGGKADIIQSLAGGAVDVGVNQITSFIPEFGTLSKGVQDFTKNVVATTIKNGGDLSMGDLVDAAITAGTAATKAVNTGTIAKAIDADKTINDAVTAELDKQLTIDASGAMDLKAATKFADDQGYGKFIFDGKTYTIDNNNAANTIAQLEADALKTNTAATTAANLKGGEFAGYDQAVADADKRNTVTLKADQADTVEEAVALAKTINPTATKIVVGDYVINVAASNDQMRNAILESKLSEATTAAEAKKIALAELGANTAFKWTDPNGKEQTLVTSTTPTSVGSTLPYKTNTAIADAVSNKLSQNLTSMELNPADLTKTEMAKYVNTYSTATDAQRAQLLKGSDSATFKVIDTLFKDTQRLNPTGAISELDKPFSANQTAAENARIARLASTSTDATGAVGVLGKNIYTPNVADVTTRLTDLANNTATPTVSADDTTGLKAYDKSLLNTVVDVGKAAGNVAAADLAGLGVRGTQFLGDLMGQDTDGFAKVQNLLVNDKDKSMSKLVGDERTVAAGIASGVESAVSFILGGPLAAVSTIAGVVANNTWVQGANAWISSKGDVFNSKEEARAAGVSDVRQLTPTENGMRTATMTAIEIAGEMLGIPGMKAYMKGIPITGSVPQLVDGIKRQASAQLSENAAEALTTIGQFSADKFASFGLNQNASFEDFQKALVDTVKATTAAVGTSSGIATAYNSATGVNTSKISDENRTAVSPDTSLLTSGASFGAKPGDTSNQGLNQVSSEAIDFNKLDQSKQTTILDSLRSNIANIGLSAALTLGSVGSIASATEVESYVTTSIQQAASTGVNVDKAINTSVSESINSAVTNKVSSETAINSAVSSAVSSAVANNVSSSTAINSAVTSAVNTASTNAASTTAAVTSAVNAAVSTAISTSVANNTLNAATVNAAVNTAVTSAVQAAVANNVSTTSAVNTAVTAAVTAAVANNVSTTAAVQAAVAAVTNLNVNVAAVTALATNVAKETAEKTELVNTVNDLITGNKVTDDTKVTDGTKVTDDTKVVTPPDVIVEPPPKTSTPTGSGGGAGMMGALGGFTFSGSGVIDPIKESFLKTYQTKDRFQDPLEKLHLIQEAEQSATQQMINQGIDPHLANVLASRLGTDMQGDQDNPTASNLWRFGQQPDDIDTMFGSEDKAFREGGFVAPLQMASGGAMPLPLLAKSGGALGALPRPDGRLDFRHGAHVAGDGDGQSDDIKAMLADGEFVFPADVVSALGNGSTKAGSDKLYEMMHSIRDRARSTGTKDLPPPALKSPLDYLKKGSKK